MALIALCLSLLAGVAGGCSTTQEKAEHQRELAERILDARAKRQEKRRHHGDGPKARHGEARSANQPGGSDK
jgi:hypothetical protein